MRPTTTTQLAESLISIDRLRRRFARDEVCQNLLDIVTAVRAMRQSQREKSSDRKSHEAAVDTLLAWYSELYP